MSDTLTAGDRYDGLACYCEDPSAVSRAGYYALDDDGRELVQPPLRLVAIDDNPGNPTDGSWHLEVAADDDPAQKTRDGALVRAARVVELEAQSAGTSETAA